MLNSNVIKTIIIMVCGAFFAIWMGISVATNQIDTLLKLSAASLLIICLILGQKIWLLMILFSAMNVVLVRGFGSTEIGQMFFLGFTTLIFLMRRLNLKPSFGELECWMLLIFACIVQTYMRNPVGLNILGGGSVGGKPYIFIALSITSAFVLSQLKVDPKHLRWAMWLSFFGAIIGIPLNILRRGSITDSLGEQGFDNAKYDGASRLPLFATLGNTLSRILVCYISPLRAVLHPVWGIALLVSLASATMSGYRNALAGVLLTYLLGLLYRGGFVSVVISLVSGAFFLSTIALINVNFPLPANIQRALSPFPGTWEERYVSDAENSSDWRVEMWIEALTSDRWIHNKILGDGVGFSRHDLIANERMKDQKIGRLASGLLAQQEAMLINGSYHSGPVHTIRTVGYVGLLILLLAMIRLAVHAHRQIIRCKGTEWYPLALFFGIPIIAHPFFFVFIFGEYQTGVAAWVLGMAMVRLLEKNLPIPSYQRYPILTTAGYKVRSLSA
jgi:hypothetical protein